MSAPANSLKTFTESVVSQLQKDPRISDIQASATKVHRISVQVVQDGISTELQSSLQRLSTFPEKLKFFRQEIRREVERGNSSSACLEPFHSVPEMIAFQASLFKFAPQSEDNKREYDNLTHGITGQGINVEQFLTMAELICQTANVAIPPPPSSENDWVDKVAQMFSRTLFTDAETFGQQRDIVLEDQEKSLHELLQMKNQKLESDVIGKVASCFLALQEQEKMKGQPLKLEQVEIIVQYDQLNAGMKSERFVFNY